MTDDTSRRFAVTHPNAARQVHAGSGAAFRIRGGLDLGEGLTLVRQPDGYRVAQDDLLLPGTYPQPLPAIMAGVDASKKEKARG